MKYWKRYRWYRGRDFNRRRSIIGTLWFIRGWFKDRHLSKLQEETEYFKIFKPGSYRSKVCAACRQDKPREEVALKSDDIGEIHVQELHCKYCHKTKPWWWFAKLPLDPIEEIAVIDRGGKAW